MGPLAPRLELCGSSGRGDRFFMITSTSSTAPTSRDRVLTKTAISLHSWGGGEFMRPHGLTIGPDDTLWATDDMINRAEIHAAGRLLRTLGSSGKRATPDCNTRRRPSSAADRYRSPDQSGDRAERRPVHNRWLWKRARVHRFSADGKRSTSGEPGAPDSSISCMGVAIDSEGRVIVADRISRLHSSRQGRVSCGMYGCCAAVSSLRVS